MATLLTHTGLVLFLVAAAVTSRFGDEQGLVVAEGESLTVQPIGTPGLLLVRNLGFEAPGFETGSPTDFTTHLAVYRDGQQIAEKTIRVNDPLEVERLHVPPERLRARAGRRDPGRGRQAAVDRPDPHDRRGGRLPVHGVRGSRAATWRSSSCSSGRRTAPACCSCSRSGPWARMPTARRSSPASSRSR